MFGKIIDGKLVIAGQKIEIKNGWITNPTEEMLKANGYKEIVRNEKQNYDSESEKLVEKYNDTGKAIEVSYETKKLTSEEANIVLQEKIDIALDEVSKEDMLKAIIGDKEAVSKIEAAIKNVSAIESKKK